MHSLVHVVCIFGYNQCKLTFVSVFDATTGGHEHVDSGVLYCHRQLEDESNYPATARTPDSQLASHGHIVNGQDGPQRAAGTLLRLGTTVTRHQCTYAVEMSTDYSKSFVISFSLLAIEQYIQFPLYLAAI